MNEQPQSSLNQTAKIIKQICIALALGAVWVLMLQYIDRAIEQRDAVTWILPAALFAVSVPLVALAAIAFSRRLYSVLAALLSGAYLIFAPVSVAALVAVIFLLFGLWRTYHRVRFEISNHIRFSSAPIIRRSSRMLTVAVLLAVSAIVYAAIHQVLIANPSAFYSRLARMVTKGALPIIERQLPNFNPADSLDQYIVEGFLQGSPEYRNLNIEERQQQVTLSRQSIAEQLGITAEGNEPLSDITERAVEAKVRELVQPRYQRFVPIVYSLGIFSLLWILGIIVQLVAQVWGIFLFWLLRKSGFLHVTPTQITAEHVEI